VAAGRSEAAVGALVRAATLLAFVPFICFQF
jgi:hypothetical protein